MILRNATRREVMNLAFQHGDITKYHSGSDQVKNTKIIIIINNCAKFCELQPQRFFLQLSVVK